MLSFWSDFYHAVGPVFAAITILIILAWILFLAKVFIDFLTD